MGGSLGTFKNGLQSLPLQVAKILGPKVRLSRKLVKLSREGDLYVSTFETPNGGTETVKSKAVVLTAPSYVTSKIIGGKTGILPEVEELDAVYYPPVASVTIAYPNEGESCRYHRFLGHILLIYSIDMLYCCALLLYLLICSIDTLY